MMPSEPSSIAEQSEEQVRLHLRLCLNETSPEQAVYLRIASVLSTKISEGYFETGEWLPSQRSLAKTFDVNLTTAAKALTYLKERGVVSGHAGKGSVVRGRALDHTPPSYDVPKAPPDIDLSVHMQTLAPVEAILRMGSEEVSALLATEINQYYPATGDPQAIATARFWLRSRGFRTDDVPVAVTAGAQHALFLALAACLRSGDVVLAPRLAYQGLKSAAKILGLGIAPVEIDEEGIVPGDLERALRNPRVKALFVMPNHDNPTGITLSSNRRSAIANIAKRHSLLLIEDDVYRLLAPDNLPSLHTFYPEGTFYFSSLSKPITPGCRFGFLAYPPAFAGAVATALRGSIWMTDRYSVALARWLMESGAGEEIIDLARTNYVHRHGMAQKILGAELVKGSPEGNIIWLPLGSDIKSAAIKDRLAARGVGVSAADVFRIGESLDHEGVRIYKASARSDEQWKIALRTIAGQLDPSFRVPGIWEQG